MAEARTGYQPATSPPSRRALHDLERRIKVLEDTPGIPGPPGDPGIPGEPGGSLLSAYWAYATATVSPPTGGQMRTNSPITQLYVNETDTDGFNRPLGLASVGVGTAVYVRAANGTSMDLLITGAPTDNGTWWTFPVSVTTGAVTKGARTQLNFVNAPTPWTALPLNGTWANFGSGWQTAQYRKIGDEVQVRGLVVNATAGTGINSIATLPSGFRPVLQQGPLVGWANDGTDSGATRIEVTPAGGIFISFGFGHPLITTGPIAHLTLDLKFSTS